MAAMNNGMGIWELHFISVESREEVNKLSPDSPVKSFISSCFEESFPEIFFSKLAVLSRKQAHFSLPNKNYKYSSFWLDWRAALFKEVNIYEDGLTLTWILIIGFL